MLSDIIAEISAISAACVVIVIPVKTPVNPIACGEDSANDGPDVNHVTKAAELLVHGTTAFESLVQITCTGPIDSVTISELIAGFSLSIETVKLADKKL